MFESVCAWLIAHLLGTFLREHAARDAQLGTVGRTRWRKGGVLRSLRRGPLILVGTLPSGAAPGRDGPIRRSGALSPRSSVRS